MSLKTTLPYLNAISSLYKKAASEGIAPTTDVFGRIKAKFKEEGDRLWNSWLTDADFARFRELTRAATTKTDSTAQRMLLLSLINGCMPLINVAKVTREEISASDIELLGIDKSQFTHNRKYIFPLDQSGLTKGKLASKVDSLVNGLLSIRNIGHAPSADTTLRSYWAYAALRLGIPAHAVRAFFAAVPAGLPILSICESEELTAEERSDLTAHVAKMFTTNPARWYAMRMRPKVKFENLKERFTLLKDELPSPEFFYPHEEICRRIGKKKSTVQRPIIPDIVFFKSRETDIYPMFLKIGDMAWCYRVNGAAGSAYAHIPKQSFELFQQAIGQFTPDYEVAPIGELTPEIGDEIVVVGGLFQTQEGSINRIDEQLDEANKIYRVCITADNGFKWDIGIDARIARRKNECTA